RSKWLGPELCHKVLGAVGLGNIGAIVAERALGLRMKVIAFDPFITPEAAARLRVELVALPDLFARADFITLHTPLTPETRGMINRDNIARMKRGVRIAHCARGAIRDADAAASSTRRRSRRRSARGTWQAPRSTCGRRSHRPRTIRSCSSSR